MLISAHVLVGTALGRALSRRGGPKRPGAAEFLAVTAIGVASHFACDMVPHWGGGEGSGSVTDPEFLRVAIPDGLVGLALLSTLTLGERGRRRLLVGACAIGACLPDADKVGKLFLRRSPYPRWLDRWHGEIQRESPKLLPSDMGIIAVVAAVLLSSRGAA